MYVRSEHQLADVLLVKVDFKGFLAEHDLIVDDELTADQIIVVAKAFVERYEITKKYCKGWIKN